MLREKKNMNLSTQITKDKKLIYSLRFKVNRNYPFPKFKYNFEKYYD